MQTDVVTKDEEIKVEVIKQLRWDARIDASDVTVTVDDGIVHLEGEVPSITAKLAARDSALLVDGVISVANNLDVTFPESKVIPTDSDIKTNIQSSLSFNSDLESYKIDVMVDEGWVTLEGTVDAYWEKVEAESEALDVNGVIGVSNNLGVVPTEDYIDESIAKDIVDALERNIHVNADDIDVTVENGDVTLHGTVQTFTAKQAAFDSALYTPGVTLVDDKIVVS